MIGKNTCNNFVSRLNEYGQRNKLPVLYNSTATTHNVVTSQPQFTVTASCGCDTIEACGLSLKEAKNRAAEMLCQKIGITLTIPASSVTLTSFRATSTLPTSTVSNQPLSAAVVPGSAARVNLHATKEVVEIPARRVVESAATTSNGTKLNTNTDPVSLLSIFAQSLKCVRPTYNDEGKTGPSHQLTFVQRCTFQGETTFGQGTTKQLAKRRAAQQMYDICSITTSPSSALSGDDEPKRPMSTSSSADSIASSSTADDVACAAGDSVAQKISSPVAPAIIMSTRVTYKLDPRLYNELDRAPRMMQAFRQCASVDHMLRATNSATASQLLESLAAQCGLELQVTLQSIVQCKQGNDKSDTSSYSDAKEDDHFGNSQTTPMSPTLPGSGGGENVACMMTLTTQPSIIQCGFGATTSIAREEACTEILFHIKLMKCTLKGDPMDFNGSTRRTLPIAAELTCMR